jgi:hypothetical protein
MVIKTRIEGERRPKLKERDKGIVRLLVAKLARAKENR